MLRANTRCRSSQDRDRIFQARRAQTPISQGLCIVRQHAESINAVGERPDRAKVLAIQSENAVGELAIGQDDVHRVREIKAKRSIVVDHRSRSPNVLRPDRGDVVAVLLVVRSEIVDHQVCDVPVLLPAAEARDEQMVDLVENQREMTAVPADSSSLAR